MSDTVFALTPTGPMPVHGDALFARDRTLRRELRRWWAEDPQRWAVWLMLNPSNAAERKEDPTTLRVTHFSRLWNYDGWVAVNLYPFISSDPKRMWEWADWENRLDWDAGRDCDANLEDIERVARLASIRIVAFGAQPILKCGDWLDQCLEAFGQPPDDPSADRGLYSLGESLSGAPLHPMARGKHRVPDNAQPKPWSLSHVGQ